MNHERRERYAPPERLELFPEHPERLWEHPELEQAIASDVEIVLRRHVDGQGAGGEADLVFLLLDLDHFKSVNDIHGHAAGDAVLTQTAALLRATFRTSAGDSGRHSSSASSWRAGCALCCKGSGDLGWRAQRLTFIPLEHLLFHR